MLIIDRAVTARHGDIVLACLDGEFTVKILQSDPPAQLPSNPDFSPIILQEGQELDIFGVVTFVLHKTRRG
ncbi:S24 family peptidase [Aeromonas veronii]